MPDSEFQGDECTEAVTEHRRMVRQFERVHHASDMRRMIGHARELYWCGGAEPWQVDARYAMFRGERRQDEIEHRELGEQRMDEQEVAAGAALVVLDLGGADLDKRHYCSRFLAGGKSRE